MQSIILLIIWSVYFDQVFFLDTVIEMTGYKDLKLSDHYSTCNKDDQKEFAEIEFFENVLSLTSYKNGTDN